MPPSRHDKSPQMNRSAELNGGFSHRGLRLSNNYLTSSDNCEQAAMPILCRRGVTIC